MLSACWLIGAYFLAVSSHKRGHLNTNVYSIFFESLCLNNLLKIHHSCVRHFNFYIIIMYHCPIFHAFEIYFPLLVVNILLWIYGKHQLKY